MLKKALEKYNAMPVHARASMWYLISSFLQKGISVISTPIFTRLLTTAEYGRYSVFNSWLGIVTVFVTLRLYYGVFGQGLVKFDERKDQWASAMIGLTTTLISVWLAVYLIGHRFFNRIFELSTSQMLAMFLMMWTEAMFSFWASRQRVEYNYRKLVSMTVAVSIAKPLFGVLAVLIFKDSRVTARVWEIALVELAAYFGLFFNQMRRGKVFFVRETWKYALAFNIPLIPHYLSQTVLNTSDRIMIERMVSSDAAGIYALAYSISLLMTLFNTALRQTIAPWIYQKIKADQCGDVHWVTYPALLFVAAVNLILMCFAPEVVRLFAPPAYHEAIWVIPPVAMSVYFSFMYYLFSEFEFYFEKTKFIALSTFIAAAINIVLNFIFIRIFGYYAAGYTTLVSYIIYAVMHYTFMKRMCVGRISEERVYDPKILVLYSAVFLAAGFAVALTYRLPAVRYALIFCIGIAVYIKRKPIMRYLSSNLFNRGRRKQKQ
ncbi:MAG: oligosaccharide flippase family protein [Lachnospiraceae bacterium]|nr:oligosaccharide flippase family protein [Lachnospiraceae bacterium]